jgi:hypothetical protein
MASKGYVESQLNRLEAKLRNVMVQVFTHVLDNLQIGGVAHQEKAINFRWIRLDSTTATTANEEFSIVHGAGQMPLYLIPLMPLDSSGAWVPRLKVTRAADASRIYLSSPDTNAQFTMLMEI